MDSSKVQVKLVKVIKVLGRTGNIFYALSLLLFTFLVHVACNFSSRLGLI